MNEQPSEHHSYLLSRNRFVLLIIGTIAASLLLVVVAMALYASSGAAQVDLTRPGYEDVRGQAHDVDASFEGFSGTGPIDEATLDSFDTLFSERAKSVTSVDTFVPSALSDAALRIDGK